jgi:galactokinase
MKDFTLKVPARICFFGDHQDYLGLPVISGTINRFITLEAKENKKSIFNINLIDVNKKKTINLKKINSKVEQGDCFFSSIHVLKNKGFEFLEGYDITISGNIPINAGLSSSSALVVAWIRFLVKIQEEKKNVSDFEIGKWSHEAEVLFFNSPGGIMDQYTIANRGLMYIDTKNTKIYRLPKVLGRLVIAESGIKKQTLKVLKKAKEYALNSIEFIVKTIPDFDIKSATIDDYEKYNHIIPKIYKPYFYSTIYNYDITLKARETILNEKVDLNVLGGYMNSHQNILDKYIKNTPKKMTIMINEAVKAGAIGAKIVGSGGGGCIVAMVEDELKANVIESFIKNGATDAYEVSLI